MKYAIGVALALFCTEKSRVSAASHSGDNFGRWRAQIREALFLPRTLPALDAKVWSSFQVMPGVVADRVTYVSASPSGEGMLVPAIVYRPYGMKGKLPGIVIVSGDGGDKFSWYARYSGMLFALLGAEVVTYDALGEGERNGMRKSYTGVEDALPQLPEGGDGARFPAQWGQRLAGQMFADEAQAVAYLRSLPEVDQKRIAVVGYGTGAFVAGLAGAVWSRKDDHEVRAVVLSAGPAFDDAADGGKSLDTSERLYESAVWRALLALGPAPDQRGAVVYALNALRGPMLVENGAQDTEVDVPHRGPEWFAQVRTKALALGGSERTMFTTHVDEGMGHRTAWLEQPGVDWLEQQIHFKNWKRFTSVDAVRTPKTHASHWITENHVEIAEGAIREDREGGVQALGAGCPGLRREQLMVLPEADWIRMKSRLTYEGWVEKMPATR